MSSDAFPPRLEELFAPLLREGVSPGEFVAALRQADPQDLAQVVREVSDRRPVEPDRLDLFRPQPASETGGPSKRKPPSVPFAVDNVISSPEDIGRFDGQPLHFISRGGALLVGVTGPGWLQTLNLYMQLQRFLSLVPLGGVGMSGPYDPNAPTKGWGGSQTNTHDLGPPTAFFEDAAFRGAQLKLSANRAWSDLTAVHTYVNEGIIVSEGPSWNDRISSFWSQGETLLMFENTNFLGDTLLSWEYNLDLGPAGWNDRISSIKNFGNIY